MNKATLSELFRLREASSEMSITDLLNQPVLLTLGIFRFHFTELHGEQAHFLSFCNVDSQSRLFAVAAGTSLYIYRIELAYLEHISGVMPHKYVCQFDFTTGRPVSDLSWCPPTRLDHRVEVMVALACGTVCLCRWIADPVNPAGCITTIERLARHEGGGVSLHVCPMRAIPRAVSTGCDNVLRLYDMQRSWEVIERKILHFAGLFVKFADDQIVLVEMDGTIRMYDARTAHPIRVALYKARLCHRIACTDEEMIIMAHTRVMRVLDVPVRTVPRLTFQAVHNQEGRSPICVCVAASLTRPWVAHADAGGHYIQSTETGDVMQRWPSQRPVRHLCWHPHITLLAVSYGSVVQMFHLR